jgi:heme a synthase
MLTKEKYQPMTRLVNLALVVVLCTIVLGAYTRLTDAGLGCPDWPGCYGFLTAPTQPAQLNQAQERFPHAQIQPHKARNEMLHRYVAGGLGLVILAIFAVSLRQRIQRLLSGLLLLLVMLQALLGMWTVSFNLLPLVVLGHLLGGFALLSLLAVLRMRLADFRDSLTPAVVSLRPLAWCALVVLVLQISLGAWTSANYAALACHQLPLCEQGWQERFDIAAAFHLSLGHTTYEYGVLSFDARMTIHILHRLGALVTAILLGTLAVLGWFWARTLLIRGMALGLGLLLCVQIGLGLINVIAWLPLLNALAHNLVAANLLMLLVLFIDRLYTHVAMANVIASRGDSNPK